MEDMSAIGHDSILSFQKYSLFSVRVSLQSKQEHRKGFKNVCVHI